MKQVLLFIVLIFFSYNSFGQQPDPDILKYSQNTIAVNYHEAQKKLLLMEPSYSAATATVKEIYISSEKSVSIYSDPILEEMFLYFEDDKTNIIRYELDENQNVVGKKEDFTSDRLWFSLLNVGEENIGYLHQAFVDFFGDVGIQVAILDSKKAQ